MWGQQIIIENRGGGAHILGASAVANAAPDGHTLMVAEAGTFVINPTLYSRDKIPFDPDKAFVPITGLVRIHHAMVTTPSFPAQERRRPDRDGEGKARTASPTARPASARARMSTSRGCRTSPASRWCRFTIAAPRPR